MNDRSKPPDPNPDPEPRSHEPAPAPARAKSLASDEPVLSLINQIKERKLDPTLLAVDDRRRCIEVLRSEGYTIAEMAQILRRTERTISRDLEALRAAHALTPDPLFVERMVGEMLCQAEISVSRLRRIAREPNASAMERLMAESCAWKVHRESFERLQSVGYLPRMATGVIAEIYERGQADPVASYDQLIERLREVEQVDRQIGQQADPQRTARMKGLMDQLERGRLAVQIERLPESKEAGDGPEGSP